MEVLEPFSCIKKYVYYSPMFRRRFRGTSQGKYCFHLRVSFIPLLNILNIHSMLGKSIMDTWQMR